MKNIIKGPESLMNAYREESPRLAILVTVVVVVLVGAPLALANKKIGDEGASAADISKYAQLANTIDENVAVVRRVLENGVVKEATLVAGGILAPKGTLLITPKVVPTNANESTQNPNSLNIKLTAIYWNPNDPLVTIDDDNYHVGDKIKGFTILEIRKTEVVFRSPGGEKVVKYFYDYLD